MIPTKEQAWDLLCEYNEGEFHRLHAVSEWNSALPVIYF